MQDLLIVVDMQNDFIDGALGTPEAAKIVPYVKSKIEGFHGKVFFTRDTHFENYSETQEGRKLPVQHCIKDTSGWNIHPKIAGLCTTEPIDKASFGSTKLGTLLVRENSEDTVRSITFVGLCTDICVISNALLAKAFLPEAEIIVDAKCCAGVTPESHRNALKAMKACQIQIDNEEE